MKLAEPGLLDFLTEKSFVNIPGYEALQLRELGYGDKSKGTLGMHVARITPGKDPQGSPWHMHHLDLHIGYFLKGWARFEFEGVGVVEFGAGTALFQPTWNRHRELELSPDFEAIEITMPAHYKTTFFIFDEETGEYKDVIVEL